MKNNIFEHTYYGLLLAGFFLILFLPLVAFPPFFFPPEWGKAIAFRIIFSIIICLFAWRLMSDRFFFAQVEQKYHANKKAIWLLFLILFIVIFSTLFSSDITFSLWSSPHRSGGVINFIFCILLSIILFFALKDNHWNILWNFSFLIGDLVVLFAIVQYFDLLPSIFIGYKGRPPSTLSNPILLGIYLILLIFPAISFALKKKSLGRSITDRVKKSIFYWVSVLLFAFGIFISGSRAAYLGFILGGIYFFLFYPKKMKRVKLAASGILLLVLLSISYVSFAPKLPSFIENNPRLNLLKDRVSISSIVESLGQTRFSGWKTFFNAVKEKPILGWGAENQSIAFDKYYDPNLNYLVKIGQNWWDRAHNIFLDLSISYGIPFLILYLFFFAYIFFKLQKNKKIQPEKRMDSHAIQSVFIAYFIALFFGFDSVTTYLILCFILGYSLYLMYQNPEQNQKEEIHAYYTLFKRRKIIISVFSILIILFLWHYALKPLYANSRINIAEDLNCPERLSIMGTLLDSKSFLDSYIRLRYVEHVKSCSDYISDNEVVYIKKTIEALKEGAEKQSKYTRTWILLAEFNNTLLAMTQDQKERESLKKDSLYYADQAKKLSPLRYEVYAVEAQTYFVLLDFKNMEKVTQECIKIDKNATGCYWYLGLAQIMTKDQTQGEKNIELAKEKGYSYNNTTSASQLIIAYSQNKNYKALIPLYLYLLERDSRNVDLRSTLAFIYRETGEYQKAREEAMEILKFNPEMAQEVQEFLNTLP